MKEGASEARSTLDVYDLERAEYRDVWDLQKELQNALIQQKRNPSTLNIQITIWPIYCFL